MTFHSIKKVNLELKFFYIFNSIIIIQNLNCSVIDNLSLFNNHEMVLSHKIKRHIEDLRIVLAIEKNGTTAETELAEKFKKDDENIFSLFLLHGLLHTVMKK